MSRSNNKMENLKKLVEQTKKKLKVLQDLKNKLEELKSSCLEKFQGDSVKQYIDLINKNIKSGQDSLKEAILKLRNQMKKWQSNTKANTQYMKSMLDKHQITQEQSGNVTEDLAKIISEDSEIFKGQCDDKLWEIIKIQKASYLEEQSRLLTLLEIDSGALKSEAEDSSTSYMDFKTEVDTSINNAKETLKGNKKAFIEENKENIGVLKVDISDDKFKEDNFEINFEEFKSGIEGLINTSKNNLKNEKNTYLNQNKDTLDILELYVTMKFKDLADRINDDNNLETYENFKGLVDKTIEDAKNILQDKKQKKLEEILAQVGNVPFDSSSIKEEVSDYIVSFEKFEEDLTSQFTEARLEYIERFRDEISKFEDLKFDNYVNMVKKNDPMDIIEKQINDDIENSKAIRKNHKVDIINEYNQQLQKLLVEESEYKNDIENSDTDPEKFKEKIEGIIAKAKKDLQDQKQVAYNKAQTDTKDVQVGSLDKKFVEYIDNDDKSLQEYQEELDTEVQELLDNQKEFEDAEKELNTLLEQIIQLDPKSGKSFKVSVENIFKADYENEEDFAKAIQELEKQIEESLEEVEAQG